MRIRRSKHDDIFSRLVRERANWACERCGRHFPPGATQGLHCSHFYGRARKSVRWASFNAFAHCYGCHANLTAHPADFMQWIFDRIPQECYARLTALANRQIRFNKHDLETLYRHLCAEHKRMMELRQAGNQGRIEFTGSEGFTTGGPEDGIEHSAPVAPEKRRRRR